jgi:hypothetical protein
LARQADDEYMKNAGALAGYKLWLAEARAEVERLRPAAEAWEAREAWRNEQSAEARRRADNAAKRARAAKGDT